MNRKAIAWLICLLTTFLIALSIPRSTTVVPPQTSAATKEIRGIWLTNVASGVLFSPWGVNRAMQQLSQLNFNTVYPVVWNRGKTFYPSTVAKQATGHSQDSLLGWLRPGQDLLELEVKLGKRQNLRIIPWFEYGFMAPANSELVRRHPDWLSDRQNSSAILKEVPDEQSLFAPTAKPSPGVRQFLQSWLARKNVWLNPIHPEVQQFLKALIVEVVTDYDVAGIQLDDHFGLPVEFGYDRFTVGLYKQEHQGKSPPQDCFNAEWMRWRADKISNFMGQIVQAVKAVKPDVIISLSPNSQGFAYKRYLQDWLLWVQRGWVEELILQVYRHDLSRFQAELQQPAVQIARQKIPVGVGILTGTLQRPIASAQIQAQVKESRDRGMSGVSFFYWESLWSYLTPDSPQQRRRAFQELFVEPATAPKIS